MQLDTNWPDNPKIIRAGWEAAGVHAAVMCVAKRLERDGWVDRAILHRMGATDDVVDRLVELGLLDAESECVRPHDWLDRNPSQAAIGAIRASKAKAGKKGNHDRWNHPHLFDECPICFPEPQVVAPCESGRIAEHRTPTKSESEVGTAIGGPIESPPPVSTLPREQVETNLAHIRQLRETHRLPKRTDPAPSTNGVQQ